MRSFANFIAFGNIFSPDTLVNIRGSWALSNSTVTLTTDAPHLLKPGSKKKMVFYGVGAPDNGKYTVMSVPGPQSFTIKVSTGTGTSGTFKVIDDTPEVKNMYNLVFRPTVQIVEENCGTTLGSIESISLGVGVNAIECPTCDLAPAVPSGVTSILGKIDLRGTQQVSPPILPDSPVTVDNINKYKNIGVYYIHIRTLSTCVSKGGVCRKCLWASGLLSSNLVDIPPVGTPISLDFTSDTTPFLSYLAKTYSGSLIGMKSYSGARLPIREGLYEEVLLKPTLVTSFYRKVAESGVVSAMDLQYASDIQSSLEKVLFLLAQYQFSKPLSGV